MSEVPENLPSTAAVVTVAVALDEIVALVIDAVEFSVALAVADSAII